MIPWLLFDAAAATAWALTTSRGHWLWAALAAHNAMTFLTLAWDKRQARLARRRVPEALLLLAGALGGTPAMLLGMSLLRHKTRKKAFRLRFWLIVIAQLIAAGVAAWFLLGRNA